MLNESLLQNFPPTNDKDVFDIIQFIKKSPLAKDYWQVLKTIYKKTEQYFLSLKDQEPYSINTELANNQLLMLTHLIFKIDQIKPRDVRSPYPTHATLRYMKRRARRFLRNLATDQPLYYFQLASKLLMLHADKPSLNLAHQWVIADVLLGNSTRCYQKGNGQGPYIFNSNRYHLHHREDGQPEIWDGQLNFVQELLMKDLPWEIYEFAIKILSHHNATPTQLSENVLEKFFNSPSHWLKRTAATLAYQTFLFQGVNPALFAGMWLYSNAGIRKKINDIDENRPSKGGQWYKDFGKQLFKYSFNELRAGNNSKRIVKALELVQQKYSAEIQPDSILPIAPALFQSKYAALNELALWGADTAQKSEAIQWLQALGNKADIKIYNRLAKKLMSKFKQDYMYRHEVEPYIYNHSKYVCDFGWKLSAKVSVWSMYNVWLGLGNYESKSRMKREYFINAITSEGGVDAFINYYTQNSHSLSYLQAYALTDIMSEGSQKIQDFLIKRLTDDFKESPLGQLHRIFQLPETIREKVLADGLKSFKNKQLFDDDWEVNNGLSAANESDWTMEALISILDTSKVIENAAENILSYLFDYGDKLVQRFMTYIAGLPASRRRKVLFVKQLGQKLSNDISIGAKIVPELMDAIMQGMNFDTLLQLTAGADEETWKNLSKAVYQQLLNKQDETGFWKKYSGAGTCLRK